MALADITALQVVRTNLITLLANETTAQLTNGPKPSYSLDGESMQWDAWRDATTKRIGDLTDLITKLSVPYKIRTRGVA